MNFSKIIPILKKSVREFKDHAGDKSYANETLNFMVATEQVKFDTLLGSQAEQSLTFRLKMTEDALWSKGADDLALSLRLAL